MTAKKVVPCLKAYAVIDRAVEEGCLYGWHRAHKYSEDPTQETAVDAMHHAVMLALEDVLQFDDGGEP